MVTAPSETPYVRLEKDPLAADGSPVCAACGHDLSGHDRVSARYCQATTDQSLTRSCICPTHPFGAMSKPASYR